MFFIFGTLLTFLSSLFFRECLPEPGFRPGQWKANWGGGILCVFCLWSITNVPFLSFSLGTPSGPGIWRNGRFKREMLVFFHYVFFFILYASCTRLLSTLNFSFINLNVFLILYKFHMILFANWFHEILTWIMKSKLKRGEFHFFVFGILLTFLSLLFFSNAFLNLNFNLRG